MAKPPDVEYLSLAGDLRRDVAVQCLLAPGEGASELVIVAAQVKRVDVVAGTTMGLRVARHLREHPSGRVVIMPPASSGVAESFVELLTPPPTGAVIMESPDLPARPRFALIPATQIPDDRAAVDAAEFALEACEGARVSDIRANLVAAAVAEFSANALQHATDTVEAPVVAATVVGRERILEVAVTDLGRGISEAEAPADLLSAVPGPEHGSGFIADLIRRGNKRNLTISVEMIAGTGRLRWTWSQHRTEKGIFVPGTTVVARIPA